MSHPKPEEIPDWAPTTEKIELSPEALAKMAELIANPPQPSERLRAAARRHWQRTRR